jgi:succinate-semialdehyde dehydrogenase/glutarate-semialdehyde dehydrogenase
MSLRSVNPATGEVLEEFGEATDDEVTRALAFAGDAFYGWRRRSFAERARPMLDVARLLRASKAEHARTMALEMGKPIVQGEAEVEKCAWVCEHYAEQAAALLADSPRATDASRSFIAFEPLGAVLAVMPWNFPFWQVFRAAAPAIMAGNTVLLKPASNVPACALSIAKLFDTAGFPPGVFQTLLVGARGVPRLLNDARIAAVTLTGSEAAGASVAEVAGRAIKKCVLELGGSDPFIVFGDADIAKAARVAADSRLLNSGQTCISAKRFIVIDEVYDDFLARFTTEMKARRVGDPLSRETVVGPQARHELRDELHAQVTRSTARGAHIVCGGEVPAGPGAFYPATILTAVEPGMPAFDEETFGPVAAVIRARDEADAIALANASRYGLGASIWTADRAQGERAAREIEAGCVFVNGMVKSDPRLAFGGIKRSGFGRELDEFGIREFTNIKTVWIA